MSYPRHLPISQERRPQTVENFARLHQAGKTIDELFSDAEVKQQKLIKLAVDGCINYMQEQGKQEFSVRLAQAMQQSDYDLMQFNTEMVNAGVNIQIINPGHKDKIRAAAKCCERRWKPETLTDILRLSITTDDPQLHETISAYLQKQNQAVYAEDDWSLRAVGMLRRSMRCAIDGTVGQITVYDPHHKKANELGHVIYELLREYDHMQASPSEQHSSLKAQIIKKYNTLSDTLNNTQQGGVPPRTSWTEQDTNAFVSFLKKVQQQSQKEFLPPPITENIKDGELQSSLLNLIPLYQITFAAFLDKMSPEWKKVYESSFEKISQTPAMKRLETRNLGTFMQMAGLESRTKEVKHVALL